MSSAKNSKPPLPRLEFPTGATVPFPYPTPYPQQTALMDTLLQCLKQKGEQPNAGRAAVMMLESPTGTGKSLSLACSALAWLKHCEQRDLAPDIEEPQDTCSTKTTNDGDDWWNAWVPPETAHKNQEKQKTLQTAVAARSALHGELELLRNILHRDAPGAERAQQRRENVVRTAITAAKMAERVGRKHLFKSKTNAKQEDFCLTDYKSDPEKENNRNGSDVESDTDRKTTTKTTSIGGNKNLIPSQLLDGHRLDGSYRPSTVSGPTQHTIAGAPPGSGVRKIIYAARTHSQLSQFVGELKRTAWGSTCRVVALGSRQLLCGNTGLKKSHKTESSLTEACLDMKSPKAGSKRKETNGCPLLESKEAVATLGLHLLTTPSDIEDAARLGTASQTCAYYASRKALAAAEVVVLPYSMLLSKSTRESIGLSLRECLVIVDEAHNLPEAIRQLHSSTISLPIIQAAIQQLTRYTQTYAQRLAGCNLMYLGNLRKLLQSFAKYLKQGGASMDKENIKPNKKQTLQSTTEFLLELKVENINLFKLIHYLEHSRLSQKLLGFTRSKDGEETEATETGISKHVSAMSIVQTFLEKLNLKGPEGKIVTDWPDKSDRVQHPTLRYVLLQPASCFENVVEEAHALALVGGTLAPFGHVAAELLATDREKWLLEIAAETDTKFHRQASSSSSQSFVSHRFAAFTCDHVVPSSNVMVKCVSFGPGCQKMDFRHQSRMASALCQDLGQALLKLCKAIPNGLVVFLPSYSYEAHLVREWQQSGLYDQLNLCKKIFREPKKAEQMESTLQSYAIHAATGVSTDGGNEKKPGGALLLSVINGKLSEGINLANSMARGVVVVGLPYPDVTDPVLQEKMETMTKHGVGGISGQAYYQTLCMRAVNQSVGRAIRHANDYAAIVLCDYRYADQPKIWARLPKWLRNAALPPYANQGFPELLSDLRAFFCSMERA